jgi:glycosyltransferase involved in cell wall biosynthesis
MTKIALIANTDWYLYNHRRSLALEAKARGYDVVALSPRGDYVDRLEALGIPWIEMTMGRSSVNPVTETVTLMRMARIYRKVKPDLVHHFTHKPLIYGSLAASWVGVPAVVNAVTGLGYIFTDESIRTRMLRILLRPLFKRAFLHPHALVIFQVEDDRDLFIDRGLISPEKTVLIAGSGVDLDRFKVLPQPAGNPIVMVASRMLWSKGIREFVQAAERLKADDPDVRFVLVGRPDQGNPSSIPHSQLQEWHDEGVIEWWGHRDDMPQVYGQAHVVVLPSYTEGVPRNLIEAAAVGRPIVATDLPGCRRVVEHGRNGLIVPLRDAGALVDALRRLLHDPDLRSRMGKQGRSIMAERFSDEVINDQTLSVYRRLLGGAG